MPTWFGYFHTDNSLKKGSSLDLQRRGSSAREVTPLSTAAFLVLLALSDGEMHAYALLKHLEGTLTWASPVGPATLYRMLRQMVTDGWLAQSCGAEGDDPRRRYFRLTTIGRRVAASEARRLESLVAAARRKAFLPALGAF